MTTSRATHARLSLGLRLVGVLAMALTFLATPFANVQAAPAKKKYIVMLTERPTLTYTGGIAGYNATAGKRDRNNADVKRYAAYLDSRHDAILNAVGGGKKLASYRSTLNGFAASLTDVQVAKLRGNRAVLAVEPDTIREIDTASTPAFLGLTASGGLWSTLGGPSNAGEGVIVGILDSGIWPENPSFAATGSYPPIVFNGTCTDAEQWDADEDCSAKVIGARYYNQTFGGDQGIKDTFPNEVNSPRDQNGHGSHTASTAVGNYNVPASAEGSFLGNISGMAPRARLAVYKVCWDDGVSGTCGTIDSVSAIEDATLDGVDVINYSISGSRVSVTDPVEFAFFQASAAGVFVAASAGNSGPGASTVAHNSPWIMTVAAGTHDRDYTSSVTLGNGATYQGKSLGAGTPSASLVKSTSVGKAGANADEVRLCFIGSLDPAKVAGKIVQCDRGVNARIDKSKAVRDAGGIGVILTNVAPSSLNADLHYVPTVHINEIDGAAVKAYIDSAGAGATATLAPGVLTTGAEATSVASFSSRGPALAIGGDLLKPDIIAPGVDVLAAVSPPGNDGRNFDFLSGTSMSSPHIAGLAALMKDLYPAFTPYEIKSALQTSASQVTNKGNPIRNDTGTAGNPFGYGAGQVTPNKAQNPGLVYPSTASDYTAFLCGQGLLVDARCPAIAIDASDLNLASIAIGDLSGVQTVKRTVKNVGTKSATYTASISGLSGVDVVVSPSSLTLSPGQSKSFTVKFTRTSAALNTYAFGGLTWSDGSHTVRSPLAIRPVAIAAPATVSGEGTSGSASYSVKFGYSGAFAAKPHGLVAATKNTATVADDPTNTFAPGGPGTVSFSIVVPAGTEYARFELFDEDTDGDDDLDLFVYRGGTLVGSSAGGTSAEQVNLTKPTAATYTVWVHAYQTDGPDVTFSQFSWVLGAADAGNLTVSAPASATTGGTGNITLNWSGLSSGNRYLGTVTYHSVASPSGYDDNRIGTTIVRVDAD